MSYCQVVAGGYNNVVRPGEVVAWISRAGRASLACVPAGLRARLKAREPADGTTPLFPTHRIRP